MESGMRQHMGPVMAQIEKAFKPIYGAMGLELLCHINVLDAEYVLTFRCEDRLSLPLEITFPIPEQKNEPVRLGAGRLWDFNYNLIEVCGWRREVPGYPTSRKLPEAAEDANRIIRRFFDDSLLIDNDYTVGKVIRSEVMARGGSFVLDCCYPADVSIECDEELQVERYVIINENGREVHVVYPFDEPLRAYVTCDGEFVGEFDPGQFGILQAVLGRALDRGKPSQPK